MPKSNPIDCETPVTAIDLKRFERLPPMKSAVPQSTLETNANSDPMEAKATARASLKWRVSTFTLI